MSPHTRLNGISDDSQSAPQTAAAGRLEAETSAESLFAPPSGARSTVVNRTRRVVHDQALRMQAERSRSRGLAAPLVICSALLLVICYAIWGVLAGYDLTPTGIPDASDQVLFLLLLWSLPVAAVALGLIWFRRIRGTQENAGERTS